MTEKPPKSKAQQIREMRELHAKTAHSRLMQSATVRARSNKVVTVKAKGRGR